jgi:hypothetical protein
MSQLAGEPVSAAGKVNVLGLSTFRGAAMFIWLGAVIWSFSTSINVLYLGLIFSLAVEYLAWFGLRRRGGPLRFGTAGGVMGVSPTTLYVARVNWWTGQTTKLVGSWPREEASFTRVSAPTRRLRRFDLRLTPADATAHLELLQNKNKDATLLALFGSQARELTVTPAAGRPWGPGWTTPDGE